MVEEIPIGSGGMGHVFRGVGPDGTTPVAIKQILPNFVSDIEYRSRIEREIEFLKKLNNDHVVHIYDHFEMDGNLFIVMELVEGDNVEQYVSKNGAIPWQDAVNYMVQLLLTMQDVHAHGIIHRDIKPGNVMIRPDGRICLLDFGVAKDNTTSSQKNGGTVFGTVIDTDGYMSPEQAQGLSIDHRSDIYGLGCVLYYMLTGTHVFGHVGSELKMQIAITSGEFPPLVEKVKGLPKRLQTVMDNAVNKNMMKRYQSCKEFATDLSSLLPGGTLINTVNRTGPVSVSVGRENCDVCIGTDNMKVSRHHADITLKRFTGGEFYVYTDCSSNGTTIDGYGLRRGMTYNIPKGTTPVILLAGEPSCRLDLMEVERVLNQKAQVSVPAEENTVKTPEMPERKSSHAPSPRPMAPRPPKKASGTDASSFGGAIASCFKKYAVFSGRASRAEYWWFWLFNLLVEGVFVTLAVAVHPLVFYILLYVFGLVVLLPNLAVTVRRLHDTGRSWVNIFFGLIPLVGGIILLVFMLMKGNPGPNKYGPAPQS